MSATDVITPGIIEWTIADRRDPTKTRIFYQSTLSIDGEVSLLSLVSRTLVTLVEQGFPLSELGNLQQDDGQIDVAKAAGLAAQFMPLVPNIAAESTAIMFGYYPIDTMGRRDPDYDDVVAFIRNGLTVPRWMDVINTFTEQNDWKRMSAPFGGALRKGVELGLWAERQSKQVEATLTTLTTPESSTS